jgi:phage-related protein
MADRKPVEFRGSSLDDLRAFPDSARHEAGHQIDLVQQGYQADDWKPMQTIGSGVQEIRIRGASGGVPCHLRREVYRCGLCPALFQEDHPEN